jgi:hypothetical protein
MNFTGTLLAYEVVSPGVLLVDLFFVKDIAIDLKFAIFNLCRA